MYASNMPLTCLLNKSITGAIPYIQKFQINFFQAMPVDL